MTTLQCVCGRPADTAGGSCDRCERLSGLALRIEDAVEESLLVEGDKAILWLEAARRDITALRTILTQTETERLQS